MVLDPDGVPVPHGDWYVLTTGSDMPRMLHGGQLDARGRFATRVSPADDDLAVGVWARGYVRLVQPLPADGAETEITLTFRLRRGEGIEGVVVDAEGEPVADLLLVARTKAKSIGIRRRISTEWGTASVRLEGRTLDYHEGTARTDARGHFSIRGVEPGTYVVFSRSAAWVIERKPGAFWHAVPLLEPLKLVAYPARSLQLELLDVDGGDPPARFRFNVDCGSNQRFRGQGFGAHAEIAWHPRGGVDELRHSLSGTATVNAVGWQAMSQPTPLAWLPSEPLLRVRIPMRRVSTGTVRVAAVTPGGRPLAARLFARLRRADDPGSSWNTVALEGDVAGRGSFTWSSGAWDLQFAYERGWFLGKSLWSGRLTIAADRTTLLSIEVPATGAFELSRGGRRGALFLEVIQQGERPLRTATLVSEGDFRVPALPLGTYEAIVWAPDDAGNVQGEKVKTKSFRVEYAGTTVLELK